MLRLLCYSFGDYKLSVANAKKEVKKIGSTNA